MESEKQKLLAEIHRLIQERKDFYTEKIKQHHEEKQQLENTKKIIIDVLTFNV
jgi:hypothetical protein